MAKASQPCPIDLIMAEVVVLGGLPVTRADALRPGRAAILRRTA